MKKLICLLFLALMTVPEALEWKYPGAQWSMMGCQEYSCLQWLDTNTPKPSEDEFNQAVSDYQMTLSAMKDQLASDMATMNNPNANPSDKITAYADYQTNQGWLNK